MYNNEFNIFLKTNGRSKADFFCKECGSYMLDDDGITNFRLRNKKDGSTEPVYSRLHSNHGLVEPKRFTSDVYLYRHTCWECYFNARDTVTDISRKSRKSKVYKHNTIPRPNVILPDFHLLYDISKDELAMMTKLKYNSASESSFINRFGEDIGPKKYKDYCTRQAYTASSKYFIKEKGMTQTEVTNYHKNRAVTLDNMISRYGEFDGTRRYEKYCKRQAYAGCKLEYFIETYGILEGTIRYNQMLVKKIEGISTNTHKISKISMELFDIIAITESMYGIDELKLVYDSSSSIYYLDFHNPSGNKVIEFYGDYWHGNPDKYNENDIVFKTPNISAKEIWKKDEIRVDNIKSLGYDVLIIWERDYRQNPKDTVRKCKEFLYDY